MSSEPTSCELTAYRDSDTDPDGTRSAVRPAVDGDCGVWTANGGTGADATLATPGYTLCPEHKAQVDLYCGTEGKLICSRCAEEGRCRGHMVTPLAQRASGLRNQLVDACEKMQLQAHQIERFVSQTLTAKEQALQTEASSARERVVMRLGMVREVLEEEEQRLLEAVQREEERVQQCLLTQRVHWTHALEALTKTRTQLVHMLTRADDTQLAISTQDFSDRVEDAEGVGKPSDTEHLNFNGGCSDSKLMMGLWASAVLLGPSANSSPVLRFDERTVSPFLSLSSDQRTLTFLPKRARKPVPYDPARFDSWPNALCQPPFSSGTCRWVLEVSQSAAFKAGVCYASVERKGNSEASRLGYNAQSWVLSQYEEELTFCHDGRHIPIPVLRRPHQLGILVDWDSQTLLFFDPDTGSVLHTMRHSFTAPLLAACAVADRSVTLIH